MNSIVDDQNLTEHNDLVSDIYEMLANIEIQLQYGDCQEKRTDAFKDGFESIFDVNIDKIDEIETILTNSPNKELAVSVYNSIRDGISSSFDNYIGVNFTYDNINHFADLSEVYSVYKTMYLDEFDWVAKVFAYIVKKNPGVFDIEKDYTFIDILKNVDEFNLDTIPKILSIMDPGNADYEFVFGSVPNDMDVDDWVDDNKVSIDYDSFVKHFEMELSLGAGVTNNELLRKNIKTYMQLIDSRKILL